MKAATKILFQIIALTAATSVVQAQVTWDGPSGGRWLVGLNWSGNVVPTANGNVQIPAANSPVVADGPATQTSKNLEVSTGASLNIVGGNSSNVSVTGTSLTNDGQISVNSNNSAQGATLSIGDGAFLEGSGEIVLHKIGHLNNLILNQVFTQTASHTIRGEGLIAAVLVNNGTITAADIDGDLSGVLELGSNNTKTNSGIIQSSSSASLGFNADLVQGATGKLIADTKNVNLRNRRFTGGTLESANGGIFESTGNSLRLNGVRLNGQLNMFNVGGSVGTLLVEGGFLTNDGTILLSPSSPGASIFFPTSGTIDGTGEIIMNYDGFGARILSVDPAVGTIGANQTIRGVGNIEARLINEGTIIAEPKNGTRLEMLNANNPKTNNNVIRADAGAQLRVTNATLIQNSATGRLIANEGTIELSSATIVGGRIETVGVGTVEVLATSMLQDVTNLGVINIRNLVALRPQGSTLTNNGTINTSTNLSSLAFNQNGVVLAGTGSVVGAAPTALFIDVDAGVTATQASGHTVRGTGRIVDTGTFINNGLIQGNSSTEMIEKIQGRLGGTGTLENVGIGSNATHAPGDQAAGPAMAVVPLAGHYTVSSFGKLQIELGGLTPGTEFDQLSSTGTIDLGGTLDVLFRDLGNAYVPVAGDRFDIITSANNDIVDVFGAVNFPAFGAGRALTWLPVDYTDPRKVTLEIASVNFFDADFDEDGDVDSDDLTRWQAGYGTGTSHVQGDADADSDVDGRDFLRWQRQFGLGVPTVEVSRVVPEPTSRVVLFLCLALLLPSPRFRGSTFSCKTSVYRAK